MCTRLVAPRILSAVSKAEFPLPDANIRLYNYICHKNGLTDGVWFHRRMQGERTLDMTSVAGSSHACIK